jgi:hypothetical protein
MKRLAFLLVLALSCVCNGQTIMDAGSQIADKLPNDGTTGTTLNALAKVNSGGAMVTIGTGDTSVPVYIVVGGAGTAGNALLATSGVAACNFDLTGSTPGHYIQASTTIAGDCHDAGAAYPTSGFTIGQALSTISLGTSATGLVMLVKGSGPLGMPLLGCSSLGTAGTTLGPVTVSGLKIFLAIYIAGYSGSDTASLQFNSSGGTAYRYRWLTSAAGGTTFAAGLVAASTDRIKIGAANTTNSRNVDVIINNASANTEKLVMFINGMFGTASAGTQSTIDIGNGAWVSASSTTITSVSIISTSNMLAGSKFCAYQAVP